MFASATQGGHNKITIIQQSGSRLRFCFYNRTVLSDQTKTYLNDFKK